jgi:hypothetical protein
MLYYHFHQNNSGGFHVGPKDVFIQAEDVDTANKIAEEETEIYFNGCSTGNDCNCCGDRWNRAYGEGMETPKIWHWNGDTNKYEETDAHISEDIKIFKRVLKIE